MFFDVGTIQVSDILKLFQIVALLSGSIFFIFNVFTGYRWAAVSLEVKTQREVAKEDPSLENLAVTINVKNNSKGSFRIKEGNFIVINFPNSEEKIYGKFSGLNRYKILEKKCLDFSRLSKEPYAGMGPGQTSTFTGLTTVPKDVIFIVEIALLGEVPFGFKLSQVKSSVVSFPSSLSS